MNWLKATGKIQIKDGVRVMLSDDFCRYYQWFITRQFPWIKTQLPAHRSHCTLVNPKLHKVFDFSSVRHYSGQTVEVFYSLDSIKSPKNFWFPAKCDAYWEMRKILNFQETSNWLGLHLVVCNTKFNG